MDAGGHHIVVLMRNSNEGGKAEKAHAYVTGFDEIKKASANTQSGGVYLPYSKWYNDVFFKYVRWESDRTGSSQGTSIPSGGNTPSSSKSGGKGKSPAYTSTTSAPAATQQWLALPNDPSRKEQLYDGRAFVTGRYRVQDGRGGYIYTNENGQWPSTGASGSRSTSIITAGSSSSSASQSRWVPVGNGVEQYYSASQGTYINKYRRRNSRGKWEEFSKKKR